MNAQLKRSSEDTNNHSLSSMRSKKKVKTHHDYESSSSSNSNNSDFDDDNELLATISSSAGRRNKTSTEENQMKSVSSPEIIDLFENSQLSTMIPEDGEEDSSDNDDDDDDDDDDTRSKTRKDPTWSCPKCTLENSSNSFACTLCGTTMCEAIDGVNHTTTTTTLGGVDDDHETYLIDDDDDVTVVIKNQKKNHQRCTFWTCIKCTYAENKKNFLACAMCGVERKCYQSDEEKDDDHVIPSTPKKSSSSSAAALVTPTPTGATSSSSFSSLTKDNTTTLRPSRARRGILINDDENDNSPPPPPVDDNLHDHYQYSVVRDNKNNDWFDVVLNQCNITEGSNNNKYYRIQLLVANTSNRYHVWTRWGRVGNSTTGCAMKGPFDSEQCAYVEFASKYKQKTGNSWGANEFVVKTKKYTKIDVDHNLNLKANNIKATFGLNMELKEMPLGVLSQQQIQKGKAILSKIKTKLEGKETISESYTKLSSQYYTAIPTPFALTFRPPAISNDAILQQCYDKCNTLNKQTDALEKYIKPEKKK